MALQLLDPVQFTIWAVALVLFALARGDRRLALAVAVVMALAPLSAELLKPLLAATARRRRAHDRRQPRGRAGTRRRRPRSRSARCSSRRRAGACSSRRSAAAFMLGVGVALLIRAWHMPSDVLGGYLLGALWIALAVAGAARVGAALALRAPHALSASRAPAPRRQEPRAPRRRARRAPTAARRRRRSPSSLAARLRMNSRSESRFR